MTKRLTKRLVLATTTAALALSLALPAQADVNSGAYLAARQAGIIGDYGAASEYFFDALVADATNIDLMEQAITAYVGTGQIASAAGIARTFLDEGGTSPIANMAEMAQAARTGNWMGIFEMLEAGREVGPLMDGLAQGWAYVGLNEMDRALQSFDEVIDTPGLRVFGQHHKALALTMAGRLSEASAIYDLAPNIGVPPTRETVVAHLQILCQMGEFDRAKDLIDRAFATNTDPEIAQLRASIESRAVPPRDRVIDTPAHGMSFAFRGLSEVLKGEANDTYLLLYAQTARYLMPSDAQAQIATARLLNALDQPEDAAETFAQVATDDPLFHTAETGRAEALRIAGRVDQAIEVLTQLTRSHPDVPFSFASLGDVHRQEENYALAKEAYDAALARYDEAAPIRWWLLYSRGMVNERLDVWDEAEADFRAALTLNPDDPAILNYLGYSIVDRAIVDKYDEALAMIETAVEARPDSGAIVDSLAWVYYKLGRYQEAVTPMERAAELAPNDPVISDHLGDVYWMVGRETEARFQWRRAMSFGPEEADADRIRRKLEIGLDAVYAQDGENPAPAVEVANDSN